MGPIKNKISNINSNQLESKPSENIESTKTNWKTCIPYLNIFDKIVRNC